MSDKSKRKKRKRKTFIVKDVEFSISYNLPIAEALREETRLSLVDRDDVNTITTDPIDFAKFVWATCKKQAESNGIDENSFVLGITPQLDQVADCWLEAYSLFTRSIGRSALARMAEVLVETDRADRNDQNEMIDRPTARRISKRAARQAKSQRRKNLADFLGDEEEIDDDELTLGQLSDD